MYFSLNNKGLRILKNVSLAISSNLFNFIVSFILVLIVPKVIGIKDYGYWQLYLLYASYSAILHFGWNDGVYLKYGGIKYQSLDRKLLFSQFWMLFVFEITLSFLIYFSSNLIVHNPNKIFLIKMVSINSFLVIQRGMLLFILQCTDRIKEYAISMIVGRLLFLIFGVLFFLWYPPRYDFLIYADLIGKLGSLIYVIYCCKELVINKITFFKLYFLEMFDNIRIGLKLVVAYIAGILIVGLIRFGIEGQWDINVFAKVSLTLNISNLVMIFVNAVGLILFPVLRRLNTGKLAQVYYLLEKVLSLFLFGILIIYFPAYYLIYLWLPQYADSLPFMGILFPIILFEGKMAMLILPFLKTIRKEKEILYVNIIGLCISFIFGYFTIYVLKSLLGAILSILIVLIVRCIIAEKYLSNGLKQQQKFIYDMIFTIVFLVSSCIIPNKIFGGLFYASVYIVFLGINSHEIKDLLKKFKQYFVKKEF